jgi:hypothetical protein
MLPWRRDSVFVAAASSGEGRVDPGGRKHSSVLLTTLSGRVGDEGTVDGGAWRPPR